MTLCLVSASAAREGRGRPLETAVDDPLSYWVQPNIIGPALARTRNAGANFVRLDVRWGAIAPRPQRITRPTGFHARDPFDPLYRWKRLDDLVRLAVANQLEPILSVYKAPKWAQGKEPHPLFYRGFRAGPFKPDPKELGRFARALALRYSGELPDLPRVRYWAVWNEPNVYGFLSPQLAGGRSFSPRWYRAMVNRFAEAVHRVHRTNVVIAGNLAPFSAPEIAIGPMKFMRQLLCMTGSNRPRHGCKGRARFDVWGYHPYTAGGPDHHAKRKGEIELGDLPKMKALLDAAVRARHIVSTGQVPFWVTEFGWDTKPPDLNPLAAPLELQARWTSEALYRMWRSGVSLVTWFLLRDLGPQWPFQSGLYFRSAIGLPLDQPKPTLTAFRFPFVAYRRPHGTFVWGRTPHSRSSTVVIQYRLARRWRRIATVRADRNGIFHALLRRKLPPVGSLPSAFATQSYSSTVLADRPTHYWCFDDPAFSAQGPVDDHAAEFDGESKIELGALDSPITLELWLKTTETGFAPIFSNRDALGRLFTFGTFSTLPFVFDGVQLAGATQVADGAWHHVVFTYSGVTGRLYVDGRLDGVQTWIRSTGSDEATLGYDAGTQRYFKGQLAEVATYDYPLRAKQVREHVLAGGMVPAPDVDPGTLRAIAARQATLPFSLRRPPDEPVLPFGGAGS